MRRFLYSRWFFAFLALVCLLDAVTDILEQTWGWGMLNYVAILLDITAVLMSGALFLDLQKRRPPENDGNSDRRR
jgi:hypothetical protein